MIITNHKFTLFCEYKCFGKFSFKLIYNFFYKFVVKNCISFAELFYMILRKCQKLWKDKSRF